MLLFLAALIAIHQVQPESHFNQDINKNFKIRVKTIRVCYSKDVKQ